MTAFDAEGLLSTWSCEPVRRREVPDLSMGRFRALVGGALAAGGRPVTLHGEPVGAGRTRVTLCLADDAGGRLVLASTTAEGRWPSLSGDHPSLQALERGLAEEHALALDGHPWPKPLRGLPEETSYFQVEGAGIHEVAVGPVHAGVIEPGHFRFQCRGEEVLHLEIALGYQHRGAQALLVKGPAARRLAVAESLAGDSVVGHALAHCHALEALARAEAPPRAACLRAVALELERLANHVGDLGMIAGDVAFQPTAAALGALRAEFLNATAELCGNRFGRGLVVPGGVRFDLTADEAARLAAKVAAAFERVRESAGLLFESASARNRTDGTGALTPETCEALGLVGPAARACGATRDVRRDHPFGLYRFAHLPVATAETGDVFARAWVRWLEAERSAAFVVERLRALPAGPVRAAPPQVRARGAGGGPGGGVARGDLPTSSRRTSAARSCGTRWSTLPFTTGSGWPRPCAARTSATSRSATRASTSPTRGTTCDAGIQVGRVHAG